MLIFLKNNYRYIIAITLVVVITYFFFLPSKRQIKLPIPNIDIHTITTSSIQITPVALPVPSNSTQVLTWVGKAEEVKIKEVFPNNIQVPVGKITFNPNSPEPITSVIPPRKYEIITTVTDDKPKVELKINDQLVPTTTTFTIKPEPILSVRPKVFSTFEFDSCLQPELGVGIAINFIKFDKVSILSPGITFNTDKNISMVVEPVSYDIYKNISIGITASKSILTPEYGFGLSVGIQIK